MSGDLATTEAAGGIPKHSNSSQLAARVYRRSMVQEEGRSGGAVCSVVVQRECVREGAVERPLVTPQACVQLASVDESTQVKPPCLLPESERRREGLGRSRAVRACTAWRRLGHTCRRREFFVTEDGFRVHILAAYADAHPPPRAHADSAAAANA